MKILASTYNSIIRQAQTVWRYECCGILLAHAEVPDAISMIMPSPNVADGIRRQCYRLDHRVQIRALELEQNNVARVVGYYHSHPNGEPLFSEADLCQAVEEAIYLVVGGRINSPRARAWKKNGSGYVEEPLELEEGRRTR